MFKLQKKTKKKKDFKGNKKNTTGTAKRKQIQMIEREKGKIELKLVENISKTKS